MDRAGQRAQYAAMGKIPAPHAVNPAQEIMRNIVALLCLSMALLIGCSQTQTSALQGQCSAGDAAACEELARAQRSSYQEQPASSAVDKTRPVIPSPSSAIPPPRHLP